MLNGIEEFIKKSWEDVTDLPLRASIFFLEHKIYFLVGLVSFIAGAIVGSR